MRAHDFGAGLAMPLDGAEAAFLLEAEVMMIVLLDDKGDLVEQGGVDLVAVSSWTRPSYS